MHRERCLRSSGPVQNAIYINYINLRKTVLLNDNHQSARTATRRKQKAGRTARPRGAGGGAAARVRLRGDGVGAQLGAQCERGARGELVRAVELKALLERLLAGAAAAAVECRCRCRLGACMSAHSRTLYK